jgi:ATP-dependent Zn protease
MVSRLRRRNVVYVIMLAGLVAVVWASYRSFTDAKAPTEKPLSDLLTALDEKQVVHGTFNSDQDSVDWTDIHARDYQTFYAAGYEATLIDRFHENQLPIEVVRPGTSNLWLTVILPNAILFLAIGGFLVYVLRRYRGNRPPPALT